MSAVGSFANGATALQQGGSPRAESPSSDSVEGLECREQCTFDEQMQRQQDGRQSGAGEDSCTLFWLSLFIYSKQAQKDQSHKGHRSFLKAQLCCL